MTSNSKINNEFDIELYKLYTDHILSNENLTTKVDSDVLTINSNFIWYAAESKYDSDIYIQKNAWKMCIYEVDINRAASTICYNWFSNDTEFVSKLKELESDKNQRNIYLTNYIKSINPNLLSTLSCIYKVIIVGAVLSICNSQSVVNVLELKKDGMVVSLDRVTGDGIRYINELSNPFLDSIRSKGFSFSVTEYISYIRAYRTTYALTEDYRFIRKGKYKHIPPFINNLQYKILMQEDIKDEIQIVDRVYSETGFKIIIKAGLDELADTYIKCTNNAYISADGSYNKNISRADPLAYRRYMIYPAVLFSRRR